MFTIFIYLLLLIVLGLTVIGTLWFLAALLVALAVFCEKREGKRFDTFQAVIAGGAFLMLPFYAVSDFLEEMNDPTEETF